MTWALIIAAAVALAVLFAGLPVAAGRIASRIVRNIGGSKCRY